MMDGGWCVESDVSAVGWIEKCEAIQELCVVAK